MTKEQRPTGQWAQLAMDCGMMEDQPIRHPGICKHNLKGRYMVFYRHKTGPDSIVGYYQDYSEACSAWDDFDSKVKAMGPVEA